MPWCPAGLTCGLAATPVWAAGRLPDLLRLVREQRPDRQRIRLPVRALDDEALRPAADVSELQGRDLVGRQRLVRERGSVRPVTFLEVGDLDVRPGPRKRARARDVGVDRALDEHGAIRGG